MSVSKKKELLMKLVLEWESADRLDFIAELLHMISETQLDAIIAQQVK